jgi:hypothetical protein
MAEVPQSVRGDLWATRFGGRRRVTKPRAIFWGHCKLRNRNGLRDLESFLRRRRWVPRLRRLPAGLLPLHVLPLGATPSQLHLVMHGSSIKKT